MEGGEAGEEIAVARIGHARQRHERNPLENVKRGENQWQLLKTQLLSYQQPNWITPGQPLRGCTSAASFQPVRQAHILIRSFDRLQPREHPPAHDRANCAET